MTTARTPLLERLALHRPELRAWALYDWANSAMVTVIITAVYPVWFASTLCAEPGVPGEVTRRLATQRHSWVTTASMALVALASPLLGAWADLGARRKRLLGVFLGLGAGATAALVFLSRGDWRLGMLFFGLANLGAAGSFVFYDALLPAVARPAEYDRASTSAYALGYLGGGLLLALNLWWIQSPETFGLPPADDPDPARAALPVKLAFASVALWWLFFSLPLFLRVREPPARFEEGEQGRASVGGALRRLAGTARELTRYRQAFLLMLAFLAYNDGIGTIIRMASIFATELEFSSEVTIGAILLVQFVGIPATFLFGAVASRVGAKRSVLAAIGVYSLICLFASRMDSEVEFLVLALAIGLVQGGAQALSRSLFASMIPAHRAGEFFGLFSVLEKFAGILGPAVFGLVAARTGSSRDAVGALLVFFALGAVLLLGVDVPAGRRAARQAEARAHPGGRDQKSFR